MTQLKKVVEPFGEVNVYPNHTGLRVTATILMEPRREGAQTGIALDGSGSMRKLYGQATGGGVVSSIFKKPALANEMAPVAQSLCAYLARTIDADHGTTCIYWATGADGRSVEVVGDLTADQAERYDFRGPQDFGTGTQLLPAVRYFVDRFVNAPWGFYVFITDGELFDLDAVKEYSTRLAREVSARRRNPLKFVLIGLGPEINEKQMEDLDDLDTGTDVDLWDHKLAAEMRQLQDIFAEVVDRNARVADNGKILDSSGRVVRNYSDTGLPALLTFELPPGSTNFTLEVNGQRITQSLGELPAAPPPTYAPQAPASKPVHDVFAAQSKTSTLKPLGTSAPASALPPSEDIFASKPRAMPPPLPPEFHAAAQSPAPTAAPPPPLPAAPASVFAQSPPTPPAPPAIVKAEEQKPAEEKWEEGNLEMDELLKKINLEFDKPPEGEGDVGLEENK
ncbi:MAG: VWA domain-containing protein [Gemmataceae bacterium]|nr:VWA domain-containing protein [Gemmataceae bacterium]